MSVTSRRKRRVFFLKWHRMLGLAASLFVLVLVVTGIALNHGHSLSLDQVGAPSWILGFYGIEPSTPAQGFKASDHWLLESDGQLFFDTSAAGRCAPPLIGALTLDNTILASCQDAIYLFTNSGDLIERSTNIPEPLQAMMLQGQRVLIQGKLNVYQFDADEFSWALTTPVTIASVAPATLPEELAQTITAKSIVSDITWERFLLDLHSGRLFGELGVWFVDLIAIVLAMLAISGVWLRLSRPRKK